jgi:hypothetical protein
MTRGASSKEKPALTVLEPGSCQYSKEPWNTAHRPMSITIAFPFGFAALCLYASRCGGWKPLNGKSGAL